MSHPRPLSLTLLGVASLVFGVAWLAWLGLGQQGVPLDLCGAALDDDRAAEALARRHLAFPGAVYVTVLTLLLELLLTLILLASGLGLLGQRPWARWSALFYCGWVILVEAGSSLARAFYLTPATERVAVLPLLINGVTILFAIVLWGLVCLPSVEAITAPGPEPGP
jgi:hypothetical protein